MKIRVVHPPAQSTLLWNGGKTTQLYIYPEQAVYGKTPFLFRLSRATVEAEQSTFSKLDGVHRILMPLKGSVRLCYKGNDVVLFPYDQFYFDGGEKAVSHGKCIDFNLMTMSGWNGELQKFSLCRESSLELLPKSSAAAFYIAEGSAKLVSGAVSEKLGPKDFFIAFSDEKSQPCSLIPDRTQACSIIRADLFPGFEVSESPVHF